MLIEVETLGTKGDVLIVPIKNIRYIGYNDRSLNYFIKIVDDEFTIAITMESFNEVVDMMTKYHCAELTIDHHEI